MAVLAAMGLLAPEQTFTHESIIGTRFRGRIEREMEVAGIPAILPRLAGEAFMTGSHYVRDPPGRPARPRVSPVTPTLCWFDKARTRL